MIKILCFPLTKLFLFFGGFVSAVFVLRSIHLIFDRALAFALDFDSIIGRPIYAGVFFGQGFWLFTLLFCLCVGLLLFSVWSTKPSKQKPLPLALWRDIDFALLALLAVLVALASFYGLRVYAAQLFHVTLWQLYIILGLPLLTYTAAIFAVTEFVARVRDKDLLRTLYWVRFFRLYPPWSPLGFLLSLLLLGSLYLLVETMREIVWQATALVFSTFWPDPGWIDPAASPMDLAFFDEIRRTETTLRTLVLPPIVSVYLLLPFSLLTLISSTYFVTFALNLSGKYAEASAEKIRAEQFKSELITNVSHDIRTPLTSVINYVDLLKKLPLEGDAADYVSVLDRKSERLKMLIDDLMDASKAGTGNVKLEPESVNLSELVGQAVGEFEDQFASRNLALVFTQPEDPIHIRADSRHLWRVLENLLSNASKYALSGTRVFAELSLDSDGRPRFALKNTSQAPLDLSGDTLVEQFIRGDRARQSEGSGLGLYIAKNLAELMDGRFEIQVTGDLFSVEIGFSADKEG
ncbi:MAG: HAMP domain-containing histidine kinase [Oscillospiraceae bacterium]|nr:HAMP domain-containing histidine kinase [Oscillospiraceae bacterium]